MNQRFSPFERGQAAVMIILAMVVLLGFTALAVDGSMIYADRRHAQNSADAASLAAGTGAAKHMEAHDITYSNWTASPPLCTGRVALSTASGITAGSRRASDNGFTVDDDASDQNGIVAECKQENVTASLAGGGSTTIFVDKYVDLVAQITDDTDTAFAHFVFGGALRNTVTAVTRIRPSQPLAYGYAIVALNPNSCSGNSNGINFHGLGGGGGLTVVGGGVFSNGCMDVDGNAHITIDDAGAYYFDAPQNNRLDQISFGAGYRADKLASNDANRIPNSAYDIEMPDCSGREYTSRQLLEKYEREGTLPSNLYCVVDELRINGGDRLEADGATFVLYNGATINGNAYVRMTYPHPNAAENGAIPGLTMYQPPTSQATIDFTGNNDTVFQGTVLAPRGTLIFNGNGFQRGFFSQLIGWNVYAGGSSDTRIEYRGQKQVQKPATLELNR